MSKITASIDINASPEKVRQTFLDFAKYPDWSSFITSVKPRDQHGQPINPGDVLEISLLMPGSSSATVMKPTVLENLESKFSWKGVLGFGFVFTGAHSFNFIAVEAGTKTKVVQEEHFSGFLRAPLLWALGAKTEEGFNSFNQALKVRAESL
ncbi:LANO_0B06634g1_1 [Lachancea nothofagi CBS 11611]|uniref:LANO_0B06634g1_1 n=1 Tax=Lachancea nothofagi CBS 11611 TaxID=1266666 RepID=A0A1G4IZ58_9SACH|nr:LANO_0B06634g1_1 [Lachancea nothofagi CBS 11611]